MDKTDDNSTSSGYGTSTETTTDSTTAEATGSKPDEASVNTAKAEGTSDEAGKSVDKPKQEADQKNVTGYNSKEAKEGSEGDAGKDAADKVKDETPLELDLKGLKEEQVKDLSEFVKEHKLTKEQAQAMLDRRKADYDYIAKNEEDTKVEIQNTYKKWEKELRDDVDFGGKNFSNSIHSVNKFLTDFMPGTSKLLTDSGKRLSPIQMREFRNIAAKLHGEGEHTDGEAASKAGAESNPWDYYKN